MSKNAMLFVFDFDHTIINENLDTTVRTLLPPPPKKIKKPKVVEGEEGEEGEGGEGEGDAEKPPEEEEVPEEGEGEGDDGEGEGEGEGDEEDEELESLLTWTEKMQRLFKQLFDIGVTEDNYKYWLKHVRLVEGFSMCLSHMKEKNYSTLIISDSNSYFIKTILGNEVLNDRIDQVITNPASFDEDGLLHIKPFRNQDSCEMCPPNLCKGQVLEEFLEDKMEQEITYAHVWYVGDGTNDMCPSLRLHSKDFVMPRRGYKLKKMIYEREHILKAHVLSWFNAFDILETLKKFEEAGHIDEDQEMIDCKARENAEREAAIEREREEAAAAAAAEAAAAAAEEEVEEWPDFE